MTTKTRALLDIVWMYIVLGVIGYAVAATIEGSLLWRAGWADLAMTVVVFGFSLWKRDSSTYDAYWSVIPSYLTIWLFFFVMVLHGTGCNGVRWQGQSVVVEIDPDWAVDGQDGNTRIGAT